VLAVPLAGQLPTEEREKLLAANRELQSQVGMVTLSGWWFRTFLIFPYIGNNDSN
jgi:hypothetical protein